MTLKHGNCHLKLVPAGAVRREARVFIGMIRGVKGV